MSSIDEIKSRINIIDLVGETVKLRRAGKNYTGFCPFHPNSRTPAFVIFPDSGTWRCFGQCNEGGDIFQFVMKKEGWDFSQTLHYLAEKAGVQLEPLTPQRQEQEEQHERLHALLEEAVTFYHHNLRQTAMGEAALAYVRKRGLTDETIEAFGLGYAPEGWEIALRYFTGKGYTQDELLQAGLVTERQGGSGVYDRFRNRIMFPIRDGLGKMAGFGARILDPNDIPKFLNSPQTVLFDKGRLLYGLDKARKTIRAQDQVVIVEGYLDAIALHQAGFTNTVSPMGTALTEDQMRLLKRFTRRIVLALDADAAGEKATLRGLEIARQSLDRAEEIGFDARGLLRHEARLQADLRVTTLPPGMDPDEVVLRDPAEWAHILESARPIVIHVMETLAAARDLEDPKTKTEIAAQIIPLIEDVPSLIERDTYRQRLARLLKVDERTLMETRISPAKQARRGSVSPRPAREDTRRPAHAVVDDAQRVHVLEKHALRLLLRQPDALYLLDRALQKSGLVRFSAQEFESADHQILARLVLQSLEQDGMDSEHFFAENLPAPLLDLTRELQTPLSLGEPNQDKLVEELFDTVLRLRLVKIKEGENQIRYLQEEAQQQGEMRLEAYQTMYLELTRTRERVERARSQRLQLD